MVAFASSPRIAVPDTNEEFLAADVGGTHVRIARAVLTRDRDEPIALLDYQSYACAQYADLSEILDAFMATLRAPLRRGVIASAGHALEDGRFISANLKWPLDPAQLRRSAGFDELRVINDFHAIACATPRMPAHELLHLCGPREIGPGPQLVLGPGTGLGAALFVPASPHALVVPTEAGQAALAACSDLELAIVQRWRARGHVSIEHAISGPGLLNLYRAICELRGVAPSLDAPDAITAAALERDDARASETLHAFCALLGSVVGDLALSCGVQGGIYLAGGVLPRMRSVLAHSAFVDRFLDKGPMRQALERIPVKLIDHGRLGVIGAAHWYAEHA